MTARRLHLAGRKFGRLTVLSFSHIHHTSRGQQTVWNLKCDCGRETTAYTGSLRSSGLISCGCAISDALRKRNTTHGMSRRPEYIVWKTMISRCENPRNDDFHNYGGRGISVCKEWRNDFARFLLDMGERPPGLTIERIDSNKGYQPDNCKWVPRSEQSRNRRCVRRIDVRGRLMTHREIGEMLGVPAGTVRAYFWRSNCSFEEFISSPRRKRGSLEPIVVEAAPSAPVEVGRP